MGATAPPCTKAAPPLLVGVNRYSATCQLQLLHPGKIDIKDDKHVAAGRSLSRLQPLVTATPSTVECESILYKYNFKKTNVHTQLNHKECNIVLSRLIYNESSYTLGCY